jgi:hypothetical protein
MHQKGKKIRKGVAKMTKARDHLVVLWSSGDREVALKMVFMYTLNAKLKGWWGNVIFVVWGPSAKLLSEDTELQEKIGHMEEAGIVLEACKKCSDLFGVSESLEKLHIDVKYMGEPLTAYLKEGMKVLTF